MFSNVGQIHHFRVVTPIGAIERAEMSATLTVLGQISEALGVEPAELVTKSH